MSTTPFADDHANEYFALPLAARTALDEYAKNGRELGGFLTAVVENNLVEAFARADSINVRLIEIYAKYLYNRMPRACWGSKYIVNDWYRMKRAEYAATHS